jgi:acyl-CoA synthetase (AMP-forming)/AMP-acid ligase II
VLANLLATAAVAWPDRTALVVDGVAVDYGTLARRAQNWARRFTEYSVPRGARVVVQSAQAQELVAAQFGAWLAGAVVVPMDSGHPPTKVVHAATQCEAAAVVVDHPSVDEVRRDGWIVLDASISAPHGNLPAVVDSAGDDGDALLLYTSGTTGPSKCVRFSHAAMEANVRALVEAMGWRSEDRCLTPVPAALPAVLATCILPAFAVGATVYLVTDRTPGQLVRSAVRYQPTILFAVPYTYELLCRARATATALAGLAALRLCVTSSAPATDELIARFHDLTGRLLRSMYCSSEAGSVTFVDDPEEKLPADSSVGHPLPGVQVSIVRPDGTPAAEGELGEVIVSGALIGTGYIGQPELTAKVFRPDGIHTGDIGLLTATGELRLAGRDGDRINHAGYNVDPREIEETLLSHPGVAEALVEGEADELEHQRIVATVVARAGHDLAGLSAYCAERLPAYQLPHRIQVVADLPARTARQ